MMVGWQLMAAKSLRDCGNPKRGMDPWLIRTHFGDMFKFVERKLGEKALAQFENDVAYIAGDVDLNSPVVPNGLSDYLHFPEMAEVSGMVVSRDHEMTKTFKAKRKMPITEKGLRLLAHRMLDDSVTVNHRLHTRGCGVFGQNDDPSNNFTVATWLSEMREGRDIMSDLDSPVSKNSFSGLVWKSMGSWRMDKHNGRVYLECRAPSMCLPYPNGHKSAQKMDGVLSMIHYSAMIMRDFEAKGTEEVVVLETGRNTVEADEVFRR